MKGLKWEERNVLTSRKYMREMRQLTEARTVPITKMGDQVLVGFDRAAYEAALVALENPGRRPAQRQ